jgi:DNA-binding NtrC family response regulator
VAKVILIGTDVALLEGLSQTLIGSGHEVSFAASVAEAAGPLSAHLPALAVVSSEALADAGFGMTLPLTPGGALIIYGASHTDQPFLPTKLQRATLAHLVLPLERHRLLALVQSFDSRSRTTGRSTRDEPGNEVTALPG